MKTRNTGNFGNGRNGITRGIPLLVAVLFACGGSSGKVANPQFVVGPGEEGPGTQPPADDGCRVDSDCPGFQRCVFNVDPELGQCRCPGTYECCTSSACGGDDVCEWDYLLSNKKGICEPDGSMPIDGGCRTDTACLPGLTCVMPDVGGYCTLPCVMHDDCLGFPTQTGWDPICLAISEYEGICAAICYETDDCDRAGQVCRWFDGYSFGICDVA